MGTSAVPGDRIPLQHTSPASAADEVRTRLDRMVPVLVTRLPQLLAEVRERFAEDWPEYAAFLAEDRDEVRLAAASFMQRLIHLAEQGLAQIPPEPPPTPPAEAELFEEIGRLQWRKGRDVSVLLSAYQVGGRVAWHHVSTIALEVEVTPHALVALAEAVFVFIDQLSTASARGFVLEQSEATGTRERLRDELVELLLSDRSDKAAVQAAAIRARWPLPREVAVLLVDPANPLGEEIMIRLDSSCLPIRRRGELIGAIVPDPVRPGRRQRLVQALRGAGAVVGHPVLVEQIPVSVRVAELAAQVKAAGVLSDDPVFAEEHLDAIIVHRDPSLLEVLRRQTLAPLATLGAPVRQRLCETLAAWLRHMGDRQAVAAELHIHPQTVRYRLGQLHELFQGTLDDPAVRARMTLALAWGAGPADQSEPAALITPELPRQRSRPTATRSAPRPARQPPAGMTPGEATTGPAAPKLPGAAEPGTQTAVQPGHGAADGDR